MISFNNSLNKNISKISHSQLFHDNYSVVAYQILEILLDNLYLPNLAQMKKNNGI